MLQCVLSHYLHTEAELRGAVFKQLIVFCYYVDKEILLVDETTLLHTAAVLNYGPNDMYSQTSSH